MKTAILALGLFVGLTQTVSFTNCCQGTLCSQKDHCPSCPEEGAAGTDDCCGTGTAPKAGETGCVHLEPSFELDSEVLPDPDFLVVAWIDLIPPSVLPVHFEVPKPVRGPSPPESPPPLYLRNLALLI